MTRLNSTLLPFYSNTPDDTRCLQASTRMILEYFLPDRTFAWEELDTMARRKPGRPSWTVPMLMSIHELGFDIIYIRPYDSQRFIDEGDDYLREIWPKETYNWHINRGTDVRDSQKAWRQLLQSDIVHLNRIPTFNDIKKLLDDGHLLLGGVNLNKLNGIPEYLGHFLTVYDIDDEYIYLNDPGAPAMQNRKVSLSLYEEAAKDFGYTIAAIRRSELTV